MQDAVLFFRRRRRKLPVLRLAVQPQDALLPSVWRLSRRLPCDKGQVSALVAWAQIEALAFPHSACRTWRAPPLGDDGAEAWVSAAPSAASTAARAWPLPRWDIRKLKRTLFAFRFVALFADACLATSCRPAKLTTDPEQESTSVQRQELVENLAVVAEGQNAQRLSVLVNLSTDLVPESTSVQPQALVAVAVNGKHAQRLSLRVKPNTDPEQESTAVQQQALAAVAERGQNSQWLSLPAKLNTGPKHESRAVQQQGLADNLAAVAERQNVQWLNLHAKLNTDPEKESESVQQQGLAENLAAVVAVAMAANKSWFASAAVAAAVSLLTQPPAAYAAIRAAEDDSDATAGKIAIF